MKNISNFILPFLTVLFLWSCSDEPEDIFLEKTTFTVVFETNGGSEIEPIEVNPNEKIERPEDPTKDDFKFVAWYADKEKTTLFDFNQPITKDISLWAKWASYEEYILTFNTNGGSKIDPIVVIEGNLVEEPEVPTKSFCEFVGWYQDENLTTEFSFENPIDHDYTLWAKWKELTTYYLTFHTNGGSNIEPIRVVENTKAQAPINPIKEGFAFRGWFTDANLSAESEFDFTTQLIDKNYELYAKWVEARQLTVKFEMRGGVKLQDKTVMEGELLEAPTGMNHPKGYTFREWRTEEGFVFDTTKERVNESMTLYAIWNMPISMFTTANGQCTGLASQYKGTVEHIDLPLDLGVTEIAVGASFNGDTKIESVSIPESITIIWNNAFNNCTNLKMAILPGIKRIGNGAFNNTGLIKVYLPPTLDDISGAFTNISSLKYVKIFESTTPGSYYQFRGNTFVNSNNIDLVEIDRIAVPDFPAGNPLNTFTPVVDKVPKKVLVPAASLEEYRKIWPASYLPTLEGKE